MDVLSARGLLMAGAAATVGLFTFSGLFRSAARQSFGLRSMSSAPKSGVRICYITVPDQLAADSLSNALVKNKLAACVNVIPGIKSTYLWEGKINNDFELLLMVKTRAQLTEKVAAFIKENHPYDEPEFICTDVTSGLPGYLNWVHESTEM